MRVLLDECIPRQFARELPGHEIRTVAQVGWSSLPDDELIAHAAERFDTLITVDRLMDVTDARIAIVTLRVSSNRLVDLQPLAGDILTALETVQPGDRLRLVARLH